MDMKAEINSALKELDSAWIFGELSGCSFGDKRLDKRLPRILTRMSENSQAPLNQTCECLAELLSAYRFIDNKKVSIEKILEPHVNSAIERSHGEDIVLQIQDTSTLNLFTHESCEGVGYIGEASQKGLFMHSSIAVLPSGLPLGVLGMEFHAREEIKREPGSVRNQKPITEKESYRWLNSVKKSRDLFQPSTKIVHVCDREGDIFELFSLVEKQNQYYVIRAQHNRRIEEGGCLFDSLEDAPVSGVVTRNVPSKGGRLQREASLEVRFREVTLPVPRRPASAKVKDLSSLKAFYVEVKEVNPPEGEEPLCWRLLSNSNVESLEDALEKVEWYSKRWSIEELHKILKSGCRVEKAQFQTTERLTKYIALNSIIAWRIYFLVHIMRTDSDASAKMVFTKAEIGTMEMLFNHQRKKQGKQRAVKVKTVKQAITLVAQYGGFLNRKNDPSPGITVIWRGMASLAVSTKTFLAMQQVTYV